MPKPKVGEIVHYVATENVDTGQASDCAAAIVTKTLEGAYAVQVRAFDAEGPGDRSVRANHSTAPHGGTWHRLQECPTP